MSSLIGGIAFLIWEWSSPVLLAASCAYTAKRNCHAVQRAS